MTTPAESGTRSGGFWVGALLALLGCGGLLLMAGIAIAGVFYFLGARTAPPPVLPTEQAASSEREFTMTVCADERSIRIYEPTSGRLAGADLSVIPGERVGRVGQGGAPHAAELSDYGWIAAEAGGGIVRWWQPGDFEGWPEAEVGIRQVLSYCEVCCASGTVVERPDGGRTVWLQDDRFSTAQGVSVGASFSHAVSAAPPDTPVVRDEMDGMPTVDLGGATAYSAFDKDRIEMLVVQIDP
jgi:hypothetical protein